MGSLNALREAALRYADVEEDGDFGQADAELVTAAETLLRVRSWRP